MPGPDRPRRRGGHARCVRRPVGDDLAEIERHDALRHRGDHAHVVLDHQQRQAAGVELADQTHQVGNRSLIHAAGDLVEQQHARLGGESARELEALPLAGRERAAVRVGLLREPDLGDELARSARAAWRTSLVRVSAPTITLSSTLSPANGPQLLERPADATPATRRGERPVRRTPSRPDLTLVRPVEARDISNSVDLPAPFGPMMPTSSPGATSNVIFRLAEMPPKCLVTASISSRGGVTSGGIRAAAGP